MKGTKAGGFWGHVLVSFCACVLTVSIVGSAVFLVWRIYDRHRLEGRVEAFVSSLENRTPEELAEWIESLKAYPKVARYVLPEIIKSLSSASSEQQQRSAVQISRAFIDQPKVEKALFRLRTDPRETIAAAAVEALGALSSPEHAADVLGQCLADTRTGAAADEACAGLYGLGEPGLKEMRRRLPELSVSRRLWLVKYVGEVGGSQQGNWLGLLNTDPDERVRGAASAALEGLDAGATLLSTLDARPRRAENGPG